LTHQTNSDTINNAYDIQYPDVTRVEVIDNKGRAYVKYRVTSTQLQTQDNGRTLKIFVSYEEEEEISI
jgi:hypothetical protein